MELDREEIEQLAARWVSREDRGLGLDEAMARDVWLEQSTAHRLSYLRLKTGWRQMERLSAIGDMTEEIQPWLLRHRALASAAAAIVLVLAGAFGAYRYTHVSPTVYATKFGERPIVRLSDGTRIQLNINTQVQTSVTRAQRMVTLERGEAYFEVVHDAKRPFVVLAGNRRITDLGTKFSVRRDGDNVKVIVAEGRVRMDIVNPAQPSTPVFAAGGNVVVAKADETLMASKSMKDVDDDLSWRAGMLVFNQETLASAAEQFNRYNRRQVVVQGAARDIRIGGSFRADNIDVFALLVRNALGLKVRQEGDQIIISR